METAIKPKKPLMILPSMDLHTIPKGDVINFTCCSADACIIKRFNFKKPEIKEFLENKNYLFEDFVISSNPSKIDQNEPHNGLIPNESPNNREKVAHVYTELLDYLNEIERKHKEENLNEIPNDRKIKPEADNFPDSSNIQSHLKEEKKELSHSYSLQILHIKTKRPEEKPWIEIIKKAQIRKKSLFIYKTINDVNKIKEERKHNKYSINLHIGNRKIIPLKNFQYSLNLNNQKIKLNTGILLNEDNTPEKKIEALPNSTNYFRHKISRIIPDRTFKNGKLKCESFSSEKKLKNSHFVFPNQIQHKVDSMIRNCTPESYSVKELEMLKAPKEHYLTPIISHRKGATQIYVDSKVKKASYIPSLFKH